MSRYLRIEALSYVKFRSEVKVETGKVAIFAVAHFERARKA